MGERWVAFHGRVRHIAPAGVLRYRLALCGQAVGIPATGYYATLPTCKKCDAKAAAPVVPEGADQ